MIVYDFYAVCMQNPWDCAIELIGGGVRHGKHRTYGKIVGVPPRHKHIEETLKTGLLRAFRSESAKS